MMDRGCTESKSLENHIKNLDKRNNRKYDMQEYLDINGYQAVVEQTIEPPEKAYMILANHCIHIFSTQDPEAYEDLDLIARSFKYTGEILE